MGSPRTGRTDYLGFPLPASRSLITTPEEATNYKYSLSVDIGFSSGGQAFWLHGGGPTWGLVGSGVQEGETGRGSGQ